jgi:hypothetical protein
MGPMLVKVLFFRSAEVFPLRDLEINLESRRTNETKWVWISGSYGPSI